MFPRRASFYSVPSYPQTTRIGAIFEANIFGQNFDPRALYPLLQGILRALPAWIFSRCCPLPHGTIVGFGAEISAP